MLGVGAFVQEGWLVALLLVAAAAAASAAPVQLIIDTDMSTDVDDVAAVCMANELMSMGEAEILAVVHNTGLPTGVGAISVVNHFYGRDHIPIGAYKGEFDNPTTAPAGSWSHNKSAGPYVTDLLQRFESPIRNSSQVPTALEVYRNVLAKAADHSVMISSIGFLSNLAELVLSPPDKYSPLSGAELIARKVKGIGVMGGGYPTHPVFGGEWNFAGGHSPDACCSNPPCPTHCTAEWTYDWISHWPSSVPIMFSGFEMGVQIMTGLPLAEGCVPASNPCRAAFEDYSAWDKNCPPRMSWDPATTLWAVRGVGTYWDAHSTGHNFVNSSTAENHWVDDGQVHNQSYLILKGSNQTIVAQQVAKAIDGLMCKGGG